MWVINLQSIYTHELRKFMKVIGESCINSEGLNHYINRLKENYKEFIQPVARCIINLTLSHLNPVRSLLYSVRAIRHATRQQNRAALAEATGSLGSASALLSGWRSRSRRDGTVGLGSAGRTRDAVAAKD